jgi:lipoprotein-anchoring transpeptidase ErfK/SrfK
MSAGVKPRYGRIAAFSASVLVTATALLGAVGALPAAGPAGHAEGGPATGADDPGQGGGAISLAGGHSSQVADGTGQDEAQDGGQDEATRPEALALPSDSGEGRRVVFDMSDQRVWLVAEDGSVRRTYLVSGSIYDNLEAGDYQVYSRSKHATGIEDSGTMKFMVRFAHGANAAIGFHDIPVSEGERVQTRDELGTPLSHGCVRQWRPDAKALWRFAPLGTPVVVTD